MVQAYWLVGQAIVEEEQRGKKRADYGERLVEMLSERLTAKYRRGFDKSNLWHMRKFYQTFPNFLDAVRRELSWTHYRLLLKVENPDARAFYESEVPQASGQRDSLNARSTRSLLNESRSRKTNARCSKGRVTKLNHRRRSISSKTRLFWNFWACAKTGIIWKATWKRRSSITFRNSCSNWAGDLPSSGDRCGSRWMAITFILTLI